MFFKYLNSSRSDAAKPNTKRCAAEDVLLRTFYSFPEQGLGGCCGELFYRLVLYVFTRTLPIT